MKTNTLIHPISDHRSAMPQVGPSSDFAAQGHSQVLAGYYDAPPGRIRHWLDTGKDLPKGLRGAMYTTWQGNFTDIEKFATAAWGGAK